MPKRAILIDPKAQLILTCKIEGTLESIESAVGGTFCVGAAFENGDLLYVDDGGMSKEGIQYFAIGARRLLAGRALLVGPEGSSGRITDVRSTVEEIERLVRFTIKSA